MSSKSDKSSKKPRVERFGGDASDFKVNPKPPSGDTKGNKKKRI